MDDDDLLAELLPRLTQLSNVLNRGRMYEQAISAAGITLERPAMGVLNVLKLSGEPLRIGEIADRMQVAGPHATRQIQGLEQRGLVRRIADPDDQRARLIELTPEGASTADRYMRTVLGWFTGALADWPAEDRRDLGRLLGRMVDDLSAHLKLLDDPGPS
ncbi:MarR family winged helix-turn-helix transcriptional regulator [Streptomyces sp. NBRC 110028]|uniref:MarR family winged helix-turn-helix transcriptional regulator n=1 Tax=Streptomyces sp. NBRC 110028 TaxID=1621260 RepID=UPI0006E34D71|nr:MarR family transcriptional regulator [Streptomyces sp. NBRC 110028]